MGILLIIIWFLPLLLVSIEFIARLFFGKQWFHQLFFFFVTVVSLIALPGFFIAMDHDQQLNDCCNNPTFSPAHRLTIYVLIVISLVAYYYSLFRKRTGAPVVEILTNCLLLIGFVLNIFIAIHIARGTEEEDFDFVFVVIGNLPVFLLFLLMMVENHRLFMKNINSYSYNESNAFNRIALSILRFQPVLKFPILLLLCAPIMGIVSGLLLLFGQKPDSIIQAFTDTYKHGFSKWDHQCDNVDCGGHFLCSVAAQGHPRLVQPKRLGVRGGRPIICNRQLLVANAFEELVEQKFPCLHYSIRRNYNRIGDVIHRHYHIFNNKLVADAVYLLMKPLEWFFLFSLYTFDKKPENRIAVQYLQAEERMKIKSEY